MGTVFFCCVPLCMFLFFLSALFKQRSRTGIKVEERQRGKPQKQKWKKRNRWSNDDGGPTQTWEVAGSKLRWMLGVIPPFLADALLGCLPGGRGLYRWLTGDGTSPRANGADPILPKFLLIGGRLAWPIHHHLSSQFA